MIRRLLLGIVLALMAVAICLATPLMDVAVSVSPTGAAVVVGMDRTFTATVTGTMTTSAVTWAVNGVVGGNSTLGVVSASGNFKAPPVPPPGHVVTLTATSVEDPTKSASANVYIIYPKPTISSITPWSVAPGAFTITVSGNNFINGAQVLMNGVALQTTFQSNYYLKASGNATTNMNASITVANPGPGSVSSPSTLVVGSGGSSSTTTTPPPPPPPQITVTVTPALPTIAPGAAQQFQATVANITNTSVTWQVNGKPSGDPGVGFIDTSGLYTAPTMIPFPGVVTITAVSSADTTKSGSTFLTIKDPMALTYGRFLDQGTFGQSTASMAHLSQIGIPAWIDEQFAMPESSWPMGDRSAAINEFYSNLGNGQDQLRQRVIYALSEIIVESLSKNVNGDMIIPWLRILSKDAFGNYRTLLGDITKDASMGAYLDMVNSGVYGGAPNENYPREVMQLFSIGLYKLNIDGSQQLDADGNPVATYSQSDVVQLAKAFTGWTYDNANHTVPNGAYFAGPMVVYAPGHNAQSKTILGVVLPAGQSAPKDLDDALDIIFNHPNVGPFIATRLIRALVTSNPSPAYIAAVAQKFNDNGMGVRGDMQAVIREILMNPEARNDNPPPTFGRLRTPVQFLLAVSRAMGWSIGGASGFNYLMYGMDEGILDAPSVFGHYSPMYKIPKGGGLFGPEFQIYSPSDAVNRANFLYGNLYHYPSNPALNPFINLATNYSVLVNAVDNTLLYGRMLPTTRTAIVNSLPAMPDNNQRAIEAIYLTALSGEFLVQR